jgi:outer membrane protein assembly factor BamB
MLHSNRIVRLAVLLASLAATKSGWAQPAGWVAWPGWRGPYRTGVTTETGWNRAWSAAAPTVAWKASVGKGFSSFAVAGGRAYTLGNADGQDTVFCLDLDTGQTVWRHSYPCSLTPLAYEGGPSATPVVDDGRLYTLSKSGDLFCLDAARGSVVWSKKFDAAPWKLGDYPVNWGYAASPLVIHEKLFLSVGSAGMALNKADGRVLWDNGPGRPGYSSPVPFLQEQRLCLALLVARGVVAVEADTGRLLWTVPWRTTWDQNAPDVIVADNKLFVSTGHGVGCALLDISTGTPQEIWRNKNMRNELSSSVLWQGLVYGFDKDRLACIDWATGETRWSERGLGRGTLIVADGLLLALGDRGKLVLAETNGQGYKPLGTVEPVAEGRYWTAPVLSCGRILVRNAAGDVVCLDVRPRS